MFTTTVSLRGEAVAISWEGHPIIHNPPSADIIGTADIIACDIIPKGYHFHLPQLHALRAISLPQGNIVLPYVIQRNAVT